jgi:hypothetical protein
MQRIFVRVISRPWRGDSRKPVFLKIPTAANYQPRTERADAYARPSPAEEGNGNRFDTDGCCQRAAEQQPPEYIPSINGAKSEPPPH